MIKLHEREGRPYSVAEEIELTTAIQIDRTDQFNQPAIRRLHHDFWHEISTAPGSTHNHQAWPGGYLEHIRQVNKWISTLYGWWQESGLFDNLPEDEKFELSEALTVGTIHDIEKPFRTHYDENGQIVIDPRLESKAQRDEFKARLLEDYGIVLSPAQLVALKYVEGMRDADYTPDTRVMSPMATICHVADLMSARAGYNLGNPQYADD